MSRNPIELKFVNPPPKKVIVVDSCDDNPEPDYIIHSKTRCLRCNAWCWLGDQTFNIVSRAGASPLCHPCACDIPALRKSPTVRYVRDQRKGRA